MIIRSLLEMPMSEPATPLPTPARSVDGLASRDALLGLLSCAAVELLDHYGVIVHGIERCTEPRDIRGHQVAGIIGFAGAHLGGTVAVRGPSSLVRGCLPIASAGLDVNVVGDWIAELANQLVGRTKNKCLRYGVSFQITPPTYAVANELLVLGCDYVRTAWLHVESSAGPLLVMLELHTGPEFTLAIVEHEPAAVQAEGELTLF
jgi:CheY-specific phosphatase CheX